MFQIDTNCVNFWTYKSFCPRVRDYPILSHTATFRLLRRSGCPCKRGSKYPTCIPGGVAWRTRKFWKLELRNFILMENLKLSGNMHQRKFSTIYTVQHDEHSQSYFTLSTTLPHSHTVLLVDVPKNLLKCSTCFLNVEKDFLAWPLTVQPFWLAWALRTSFSS